ncbi:MAG: EFR1 family ferrodoxin [Promethearchaeota archaeon]
MNIEIYYFTGTGNSLVVASDMAEKLRAKLIPIAPLISKKSIEIKGDIVGIVFPVYFATNLNSGIPLIVERFLNKIKIRSSQYVFAVCTHSGMPGTTMERVAKVIKSRGGILAGGFSVKTYNNAPLLGEKLKKIFLRKDFKDENRSKAEARHKKLLSKWKIKLEYISNYINQRKRGKLETRKRLTKLIYAPLLRLLIKPVFNKRYKSLSESNNIPFKEMILLSDKSFRYNKNCNGCGICVQICPVNNIKLVNSRPVWQNHCENCFACFTWCPNNSIYGKVVEYAVHYHHPHVKLSDMILIKSQ